MLHITRSDVFSATSLLMLLLLVPESAGSGQIEVWFVSYSSNCDLDLGSECDPMFTFCMGRPQSTQADFKDYTCTYGKTLTSKSYGDINSIYFMDKSSIGGLANPWIISTAYFYELAVMIAVEIYDDDPFNSDDLMVVFQSSIPVAIGASRNEAQWSRQVLRDGTYYMDFNIRLYCDPGYFTSSCDVYCSPQNTSSGHYTCQAGTGKKICMQGWNGTSCSNDINECTLGFCWRGNCTNLPGDYMCTCPQNYTGKNCSVLKNPCLSTSCLNGGTCFAHPTEYTYLCTCPAGWQGNHCETRTNPCNSQPCLNGGLCNSDSVNGENFTCTCVGQHGGASCEHVLNQTVTPPKNGSHDNSSSLPNQQELTEPMVLPTWAIATVTAGGGLIVVVLIVSLVHIIKGRSKLFARKDPPARPEIFVVESCGAQFCADNSSEGIKAKNAAGTKPFKPDCPTGAASNQYAMFLDINHHTEASATEEQFEEVYEEIDAIKMIYSNQNTKAKNGKVFKTGQDKKVFKEPENYYLQPLN